MVNMESMGNEKRIRDLVDEKYQALFGVRKETFEAMLAIFGKGIHGNVLKERTRRKFANSTVLTRREEAIFLAASLPAETWNQLAAGRQRRGVRKKFKEYPIGFFHVDITEARIAPVRRHRQHEQVRLRRMRLYELSPALPGALTLCVCFTPYRVN